MIHLKFGKLDENIMWISLGNQIDRSFFVAPNLLMVESKCFIVDQTNKLYTTDIDLDRFPIKESKYAIPGFHKGTDSIIVSTWHHEQYFNILTKEEHKYKHHIFGRIDRKNIKYLSKPLRQFILFILLCFKNAVMDYPYNYIYYIIIWITHIIIYIIYRHSYLFIAFYLCVYPDHSHPVP